MLREYKVVMSDKVNGERFTFAMRYKALNMRAAGEMAIAEFGPGNIDMRITATVAV